jgi:lysozyme family protein
MFAISREETLAALEHMAENNLKYYDAHCPKCRRANRVERFKLEFSYPGWRETIEAMAKEAAKAEAEQAAPVTSSPKGKPVAAPGPVKAPAAPKAPVKAAATSSPKGKPAAKSGKKPAPATASPKGKKK